jgi:uncharacterized protein YecT (DUF1311 family)
MTRLFDTGLAGLALGGLLALGAAWTAPANAEGVPASFDCAKAGQVVEKFICSQAVLRWQDLALSRSYRAARGAVAGSARDSLLASQRDWVRERDRRCIADRTFKELSDPSTGLQSQAYDCLKVVYLGRRGTLQDLAAAPLSARDIKEIDLKPIASARPEIADGGVVRVSEIRLSTDGTMAAVLLPSLELDGPDQVWLYRIADGRLVAATPAPDRQQPHPDGAVAAVKSLVWQGDTLYTRVAVWSKKDQGEEGATAVYAATIAGSRRLDDVPGDIHALLDDAGQPDTVAQDEVSESESDILETVRGNRDFLAWTDDLGHGTIELRLRKRTPRSPAYLVAWGGWELASYLFDTERSRLVYPGDTGITVFDMATRGERRIAGTSQGDWPYAFAARSGLFIWFTRNACGDELMSEQDEDAPGHFCLSYLPKQAESK